MGNHGSSVDVIGRKLPGKERISHPALLSALCEINVPVNSVPNLQTLLDILLQKIETVFAYSAASIRVMDPGSGETQAAAFRPISEKNWNLDIPIVELGLSKLVLEKKIVVAVPNVLKDSRINQSGFFRRHGWVSYVGLPLLLDDRLIGMISLLGDQERRLSDQEVQVLLLLAGQAARAIHNFRLYEDQRKKGEELSSFYSVTTRVSQSFASEHSLHQVVTETRKWFQFDSISVYLLHDESDEFRLEGSFPEGSTFGTDVVSFQRGEGNLGRVAETGKSISFAEVHADPHPAEFRQRDGHSESSPGFLAIFPIKTQFKVWGVLVCGGQTPGQLNGGELDIMNAICHQIAMAVENGALLERIGAKGKEIAALYSIAGIASEFLDVNAILRNVLYKMLQIFQFDAARIYVRDRVGSDLRLVAQEGFAEEPSFPPSFRNGEGAVGHAFQTGETLIFEDLQKDAGYYRLTREENILRAGFRGAVFVPIRVRGENLGVLNLLSRAVHPFPPSDLQLLNSIAYHLGIAVGNATLFSQLKKKTLELEKANQELRGSEQVQELLKELSQDMISLDISELLRKLTERVRKFLGTDIADVRLFEGEGWQLRALSGVEPERIPLPWSQSTSTRRRSVWIREHRKPLTVSDITQGEMKSSGHVLESAGIRGYLGVPIQARGGEVLGILRALSRNPREFTDEEVDLLMQLATGTAIVLDNARLLAQVKQQAVDLHRANKGKDEFLSVVSHELRTPLNVIMGFTGLMRDEMLGGLKPEQQSAVEAIHRQSQSLLSMVSSILQATKIDAEAIRAERREFPLQEFLDKLKVSCELLCAKERVVVRWDYPVELPCMESDEEMCRHILHNLIDNAVKFTEQGQVRIAVRYDSHADIVEFEVADTGIGITNQELPIIFDKFRQVDSSETRRYDGVGLGLYIVKKYTEILGGKIRVASHPGLGSTFSVSLPRRPVHYNEWPGWMIYKNRLIPGVRIVIPSSPRNDQCNKKTEGG